MRTFGLACELELRQNESGTAEDSARRLAEDWLHRKLSPVTGSAHTKNFVPAWRNLAENGSRVWELVLSQNSDRDDGLWLTEVRCASDELNPRVAFLSVVMRVQFEQDFLAPVYYYVEAPGLIRDLDRTFQVCIGASQAQINPIVVSDENAFNDFLHQLATPSRSLPLVVVTDPVYGDSAIPDLAMRLAKFLFGVAIVVHLERAWTFRLTEEIGKEMSVFDGGVRLYWPGWFSLDAPRKHPLFLGYRIRTAAAQTLEIRTERSGAC